MTGTRYVLLVPLNTGTWHMLPRWRGPLKVTFDPSKVHTVFGPTVLNYCGNLASKVPDGMDKRGHQPRRASTLDDCVSLLLSINTPIQVQQVDGAVHAHHDHDIHRKLGLLATRRTTSLCHKGRDINSAARHVQGSDSRGQSPSSWPMMALGFVVLQLLAERLWLL